MKKRLMMLMMVCALAISGIGGMTLTANAANTEDKPYSFNNSNAYGVSEWRDKNDTTKVYVYPKSGPDIYYTVQGKESSTGSAANRSNTVIIPLGVQGSITNTVREKGGTYARLQFQRIITSYVSTQGVWSPDSTKNYTIFN